MAEESTQPAQAEESTAPVSQRQEEAGERMGSSLACGEQQVLMPFRVKKGKGRGMIWEFEDVTLVSKKRPKLLHEVL